MVEWIKKRAAELRKWEPQTRKAKFIESHSHQLFQQLCDLMETSVQAFNAEVPGSAQ